MAENGKTFEIGLVMAGAISAGAYSGGVVDFLIEALDEWTKAKDTGGQTVPTHDVLIKVMTGASAGAITACLLPITVVAGNAPKPFTPPQGGSFSNYKAYLPGMYTAWVEKPTYFAASGPTLLGTDDLDRNPDGLTISLLDCTILDEIVADALKPGPGGGVAGPRPYFRKDLPVYITLANLRGVPYSISLSTVAGTPASHGLMLHADRAMFKIRNLGTTASTSPFADNDSGAELDTTSLGTPAPSPQWQAFAMTGVASSAFPVALAPRPIEADPAGYSGRKWPIPVDALFNTPPAAGIKADWPGGTMPAPYKFTSVDGGTFDNEPLGYARYALMKQPPQPNARDQMAVDRAVVMIDPFPGAPDFPATYQDADATLMGAIKRLLPAFIDQSRFKLIDLAAALDETVYSRFLIAPKRANGAAVADFPIACGLLGGFGGFIAAKFREHDYQLGRRNCQQFLAESFALPVNHSIILAGGTPQLTTDLNFARIVPLVGSAAKQVAPLAWPQIDRNDIVELTKAAMKRANRIVPRLLENDLKRGWFVRTVFSLWWKWPGPGRGMLESFIYQTVQGDLIRRDQLAATGLFRSLANITQQQQRDVLAALCTSDEGFIGLDEIERRSRVDKSKLPGILGKQSPIAPLVATMPIDGEPGYRIAVLRSS